MNRADLSWALNAVLPHAGNEKQGLNYVGLAFREGASFLYATDKYTAAVARVNEGMDFTGALSTKEATDLMRFVRPNKVGERTQELVYAQAPGELHIGYDDLEESGAWENGVVSQVFETREQYASLDLILNLIKSIEAAKPEWDRLILMPKLVERFAKAQRVEADRMVIVPKHRSDKAGAAIVTVGDNFTGVIAGMTYEKPEAA